MTGLSIAQIEAWRAGDVREVSTPPAASPRPPYVHASGVVVYVAVSFDKPFPEDVWPAALDIVTAGATRLGITDRESSSIRPATATFRSPVTAVSSSSPPTRHRH